MVKINKNGDFVFKCMFGLGFFFLFSFVTLFDFIVNLESSCVSDGLWDSPAENNIKYHS